jgi:hypothetical protein
MYVMRMQAKSQIPVPAKAAVLLRARKIIVVLVLVLHVIMKKVVAAVQVDAERPRVMHAMLTAVAASVVAMIVMTTAASVILRGAPFLVRQWLMTARLMMQPATSR